ncbi:hypothetical protein niasHT_000314 [Heterodera trifolii]|uniref:Uncharacterized protein n=1 Tax=Heterodera trifolii TaxID=157864 RepID=A0ABD2LTS3_9BILA
MASFVKLFKRKTSKQGSLSDPFNSAEMPSKSSINVMHDGKQIRTASFRINRKPNAQKYECGKETKTNGGEKQWANATEYSHHKSPYSVFTEPKMGRSARSCPVGPPGKETNYRMRNSHNFSPPFGVQPTIHERSGSYENFTASQLQQFWGVKQSEREEVGKENEEGSERERNAERSEEEKPHQKRQRPQRGDGMATHGNLAKRCRCHGGHSSAHCFHQYPQQQPLSTSEYWSNDPSPIGESQSHHRHFRVSQGITNGIRGEMTMALVGLEMAREESSSEDGDNSSDDQEISPTALLQFWQQQVRMLKRELKSSRETTEKYRNKYLRLKTKTDELSSELTREKERNIWLFNQLIATNDKMTRLNWAHIYFRGTQTQQNPLTMNATEIAENEPFGPIKDERLEDGRKLGKDKCADNAQHRSTAGEVQAELSSDDFDDKSATMREGICRIENEHGCQIMAQQQKPQPQSMRTPTPVPLNNANDSPNGLLMGNFLCAPPFLNFNTFHNAQQIQNQLHVEVARGGHLNNARNSNSRLISPPIKKGVRKTDKSNSPLAIEEDETEEQLKHEEEEEDNDSLTGIDLEENGPIVIPLDAFCHQQIENSSKGTEERGKESLNGRTTKSVKSLLRNCHSSEDLRFSAERGTMVGSAVGSSSEDDLRMWKKQLRSRGDRVLFRPSRKTLFSGVIGNEKGPNKYFRRFGQPEREALAKFDYLCDEGTDVSGLMSSPEKING